MTVAAHSSWRLTYVMVSAVEGRRAWLTTPTRVAPVRAEATREETRQRRSRRPPTGEGQPRPRLGGFGASNRGERAWWCPPDGRAHGWPWHRTRARSWPYAARGATDVAGALPAAGRCRCRRRRG